MGQLAPRRRGNAVTDEQLAFDIEGMLHDAAFEHWQFLHTHDKTHVNSRMWRRSITVAESDALAEHGFVLFTADLRCEPWKHADAHEGCECLGDLMYQAICEPCHWSGIADHENDAVEMWHDHALPRLARATDRAVAAADDGQGRLVEGRGEVDRRALPEVDAGARRSDHHRAPPVRDTARP